MNRETREAIADALCAAADELEALSEEHLGNLLPPTAVGPHAEIGQMRGDARWLRKKGVALRAQASDD